MKWIFGSLKSDFLWLYAPGLLGIFACFFVREDTSISFFLLSYVVYGILDDGHVYATVWRTYLNPNERVRSLRMTPFFILLGGFFYLCMRWNIFIPFIATPIVYFRIFHTVRQFYGISKWNQQLNGVQRKSSDNFLYLLCFLPVLAGAKPHELEFLSAYLSGQEIQNLRTALFFLYFCVITCWLVYEARIWKEAKELNRLLSVAGPAAIFGISFTVGASKLVAGFPLSLGHGAAYFGLTYFAMNRTGYQILKTRWGKLTVFALPIFLGTISFLMVYHSEMLLQFGAILSSTTFCAHQYFDTYLWKRNHPEAKLIYAGG